jgi:hypothetical protein
LFSGWAWQAEGLKGKEAIKRYWGEGLAMTPGLHFKLLDVAICVSAIAILYESATLKRRVVERIEFDERGLGIKAEALQGAVSSNARQ